jgi:hypothetical protein
MEWPIWKGLDWRGFTVISQLNLFYNLLLHFHPIITLFTTNSFFYIRICLFWSIFISLGAIFVGCLTNWPTSRDLCTQLKILHTRNHMLRDQMLCANYPALPMVVWLEKVCSLVRLCLLWQSSRKQWSLVVTNPRGYWRFFIISEIHYNQFNTTVEH